MEKNTKLSDVFQVKEASPPDFDGPTRKVRIDSKRLGILKKAVPEMDDPSNIQGQLNADPNLKEIEVDFTNAYDLLSPIEKYDSEFFDELDGIVEELDPSSSDTCPNCGHHGSGHYPEECPVCSPETSPENDDLDDDEDF